MIIVLSLKESFRYVPDMDFFYYTFTLSQWELLTIELPKLTPSILMENYDHSIYPD